MVDPRISFVHSDNTEAFRVAMVLGRMACVHLGLHTPAGRMRYHHNVNGKTYPIYLVEVTRRGHHGRETRLIPYPCYSIGILPIEIFVWHTHTHFVAVVEGLSSRNVKKAEFARINRINHRFFRMTPGTSLPKYKQLRHRTYACKRRHTRNLLRMSQI